jgi:hypothetical protein
MGLPIDNQSMWLADYEEFMENRALELEELTLTFFTEQSLDHLFGFLDTCRDIKKFNFCLCPKTKLANLTQSLRKFLVRFTQIEELKPYVGFENDNPNNEVFDLVTECCHDLRKLAIPENWADGAKSFFQHRNLEIAYLSEISMSDAFMNFWDAQLSSSSSFFER